jgi:hypothetical protein
MYCLEAAKGSIQSLHTLINKRLDLVGAALAAFFAAKAAPTITLYNDPKYFALQIEPLLYSRE